MNYSWGTQTLSCRSLSAFVFVFCFFSLWKTVYLLSANHRQATLLDAFVWNTCEMHVKHMWNFHTQSYVKFVWNACEKMCENNVTFHTQNCVKIVWILCEKISLSERDRMCENCVKKGVKKKCVKITSLFTHRYVKIVWNGNFIRNGLHVWKLCEILVCVKKVWKLCENVTCV